MDTTSLLDTGLPLTERPVFFFAQPEVPKLAPSIGSHGVLPPCRSPSISWWDQPQSTARAIRTSKTVHQSRVMLIFVRFAMTSSCCHAPSRLLLVLEFSRN